MPGVSIAVFDQWEMTFPTVRGFADITCAEVLTPEHVWDLASLTKTLVTLPEVLALADDGVIDLDVELSDQWARARRSPVGSATPADLLAYRAGLPASGDYFRQPGLLRDQRVDQVLATELSHAARGEALYSDVGLIALGEMVAEMRGQDLATLARHRSGLLFRPTRGPFVATELCEWRGRLVKGEVHDENAAALDGVAGHAGAFGTLADVVELARRWWRAEVVSVESHRRAVTQHSAGADGERYGLAWRLSGPVGLGGSTPGRDGWGISGFVGHRLWVEPSRGYGVVVLSNRIHPRRVDRAPFDAWCCALLDQLAATA